jgi:hypothetical protein
MSNYLDAHARERARQMDEAWRAYNGDFPRPLKVRPGQTDDNVISNRCAPIVDKGVAFLFGQEIHINVDQHADNAAQAALKAFWTKNRKQTTLTKLATNGAICGHGWVKIIPGSDNQAIPRLVVLDPACVTVETAPDDVDTVMAINVDYAGYGKQNQPVTCRERIIRIDQDGSALAGAFDEDCTWQIQHFEMPEGGLDFTPIDDPVDWPHTWPPVLGCQNLPASNTHYGKPDLTPDIIEMNRVLNFVQSNTARIIKNHAHPKTWGHGFAASQIDMSVDNLISLPNDNATLQNLEMHSDLASSLTFAGNLRTDMDEQSRVPAVALGRQNELPRGNISGVALQLMFQPLLEKTRLKQMLYGELIDEICAAILELMGFGTGIDIDIQWPNLLPIDDLAAAQTALALLQIGVSKTTVMSQLGYDPDQEGERTLVEGAKTVQAVSRGQAMPTVPPAVPVNPAAAVAQAAAAAKIQSSVA